MHLEAGFDWSVMCRLLARHFTYRNAASYPLLRPGQAAAFGPGGVMPPPERQTQ
jgi:hypothetical protein